MNQADPRQMYYAKARFDYTTLFRAWFREWSDYEAMWQRLMLEPEEP